MRPSINRTVLLLLGLALAPLASAAMDTPAPTAATPAASPAATASPATSPQSSSTFAVPSPRPTPVRPTSLPTVSPKAPVNVEPTPVTAPDDQGDDASGSATAPAAAAPTSPPVGAVHTFRTPDREAPPAFVQPQVEPPPDTDDAQPDDSANDSTVPPDRPYVATITFHAVASTDLDSFDLNVIYPRDSGEFVRSGAGVDCRKTVDAMMFADDRKDGTLRLVVGSDRPLIFPIDIACRFTVAPNAVLNARLIAVNVLEVTNGNKVGDPSEVTVSVSAQ